MNLRRRAALLAAPALLAAGGTAPRAAAAAAASWPTRPVRMVIPFPPGGTTDLMGRLLAERLGARLGQPVVTENRPGAGGNIGAEAVARAEPDGYTILVCSVGTAAINYAAYGARMPYRPDQLAALGLIARSGNVLLASRASGLGDVASLLARARREPGRLNYGTSGIGGSPHAMMELLQVRTGTQLQHVPYRGSGPMLTELVAGRIELGMDNIASALNFVRDGQMRALAVTTAARVPALPDVPTMAEAGVPEFEATAWFGVQAPAATPAAIVERLGAEIDAVVRDETWVARLRDLAADPPGLTPQGGTTPAAFAAFVREEIRRWAEVARSGNIVAP